MTIAYCERSTIREAWAGAVGVPGQVDPDEARLITRTAQRENPELTPRVVGALLPEHAHALTLDPEANTPPLWTHQMSWADGSGLARYGHRLLTVHRIIREDHRYETYEQTLRPHVRQWLEYLRQAHEFGGIEAAAAGVVFGYTNVFKFEPEEDLSEYFRFNFEIEAQGVDDGLVRLAFGTTIERQDQRSRVHLQWAVEVGEEDMLLVKVTTVGEYDLAEGLSLASAADLDPQILQAKNTAKETFFSFVTEQTLSRMGAVDDDDS